MTIVPTRPDIFTDLPVPGPFGRALVFNVTNRVLTTEPFTVTTVKIRGGTRVPTVLRFRMTGVANISGTADGIIDVRIGDPTITGSAILTGGVLVEPGVYTFDFRLPAALNMAGDQPIVVSVRLTMVLSSVRGWTIRPRGCESFDQRRNKLERRASESAFSFGCSDETGNRSY